MATKQLPVVNVERREKIGSRYADRLRKAGRLPAVVYGHQQNPVHVSLDRKEIVTLLHNNAHIIEVNLDGKKEPALIKDVQWDHLGAFITHVDLARIDLTQRVTVEVPLVLVGEAAGLKEAGAILEHPLGTIEIECLALEIPDNIKVDVSELKVGDTLLIKDIKLPAGVTTTLDPETMVAGISTVKEEVIAATPAEGAAPAEPEVIGRKTEEAEEGAGEEGEKKAAAPAEKKAEKK